MVSVDGHGVVVYTVHWKNYMKMFKLIHKASSIWLLHVIFLKWSSPISSRLISFSFGIIWWGLCNIWPEMKYRTSRLIFCGSHPSCFYRVPSTSVEPEEAQEQRRGVRVFQNQLKASSHLTRPRADGPLILSWDMLYLLGPIVLILQNANMAYIHLLRSQKSLLLSSEWIVELVLRWLLLQ